MNDSQKKRLAQAKVGLDALIDEATGYQEVRPDGELAERYVGYGGSESDYHAPDTIPDEDES